MRDFYERHKHNFELFLACAAIAFAVGCVAPEIPFLNLLLSALLIQAGVRAYVRHLGDLERSTLPPRVLLYRLRLSFADAVGQVTLDDQMRNLRLLLGLSRCKIDNDVARRAVARAIKVLEHAHDGDSFCADDEATEDLHVAAPGA